MFCPHSTPHTFLLIVRTVTCIQLGSLSVTMTDYCQLLRAVLHYVLAVQIRLPALRSQLFPSESSHLCYLKFRSGNLKQTNEALILPILPRELTLVTTIKSVLICPNKCDN